MISAGKFVKILISARNSVKIMISARNSAKFTISVRKGPRPGTALGSGETRKDTQDTKKV